MQGSFPLTLSPVRSIDEPFGDIGTCGVRLALDSERYGVHQHIRFQERHGH